MKTVSKKNLTLCIPEPVKKRAKAAGLNMSRIASIAIEEAVRRLETPLIDRMDRSKP